MTRILEVLVEVLVQLDLVAVAVGLWTLLWTWRRRPERARRALVVCLAALGAIHLLPTGRWALTVLERRFASLESQPAVDAGGFTGLVLLGGGCALTDSEDLGRPVYNFAGARFFEFVALARRHPEARLIFTGNEREAALARRIFAEQGIDASRVTIDGGATTTLENARRAWSVGHPAAGERWGLVTSAWHMPRAAGLFRGAGWDVTPCPVAYLTSGTFRAHTLLSSLWGQGGLLWRISVHEVAGLLYHYLAGDSPDLYPGPR